VKSREPLWDQPGLPEDVEAGRYYLPGAPTGYRETIVTTPVEAEPLYVVQIPGPGWAHLLAAVFTAGFFLLLTVKFVALAVTSGVLAVVSLLVWIWQLDPGPSHPPVDIGGGLKLPVYLTGPRSHSWWSTIVFLLVAGTLYLCVVFSYLFLWLVNPDAWPPEGMTLPDLAWPAGAAALYVLSGACVLIASALLARASRVGFVLLMLLAVPLLVAGFALDGGSQWFAGLRAPDHSYGAIVYTAISVQGLFVVLLFILGLYTIVRLFAGKLDAARRGTFDVVMLLWVYAVGQGIVGLALVHGFPRAVGG
jgi:cytochrome c oxidase subunit I+III